MAYRENEHNIVVQRGPWITWRMVIVLGMLLTAALLAFLVRTCAQENKVCRSMAELVTDRSMATACPAGAVLRVTPQGNTGTVLVECMCPVPGVHP